MSRYATLRTPQLLFMASSALAQMTQVYVPGNADAAPGVQVVNIGAGVDGMTTFQVGPDATLVEATGTAQIVQGGTTIACNLGDDGYATCTAAANGNPNVFAYTEPITYFGETTGQATPTTSVHRDAGGRITTGIDPTLSFTANLYSGTLKPDNAPVSLSTQQQASTSYPAGPNPVESQSTSSNVFYKGLQNAASPSMTSRLLLHKLATCGATFIALAVCLL